MALGKVLRWTLPALLALMAALYIIQYRCLHASLRGPETSFEDVLAATGITKRGLLYDIFVYRSSDGVRVTSFVQHHRSSSAAREELELERRRASEIVYEEPVVGKEGKASGTRLILRFNWGPIYLRQEVVWTEGTYLRGIYSRSPRHIEAFEAWAGSLAESSNAPE